MKFKNDDRFKKIEIAFTDYIVDMQKVLDAICEGISSFTKSTAFVGNMKFIRSKDLKDIYAIGIEKGDVLFWQSKKLEIEPLFMRDIQVTYNVRRA